jgi:hypothetical protein
VKEWSASGVGFGWRGLSGSTVLVIREAWWAVWPRFWLPRAHVPGQGGWPVTTALVVVVILVGSQVLPLF